MTNHKRSHSNLSFYLERMSVSQCDNKLCSPICIIKYPKFARATKEHIDEKKKCRGKTFQIYCCFSTSISSTEGFCQLKLSCSFLSPLFISGIWFHCVACTLSIFSFFVEWQPAQICYQNWLAKNEVIILWIIHTQIVAAAPASYYVVHNAHLLKRFARST